MPRHTDRTKETTTTTGTGAITTSGTAPSQYQTIATAGLVAGDRIAYAIAGQSGTEWETGQGTLTSTTAFTRDRVEQSSNSNALVSFSAGTKDVSIVLLAAQIMTTGRAAAHAMRRTGR